MKTITVKLWVVLAVCGVQFALMGWAFVTSRREEAELTYWHHAYDQIKVGAQITVLSCDMPRDDGFFVGEAFIDPPPEQVDLMSMCPKDAKGYKLWVRRPTHFAPVQALK